MKILVYGINYSPELTGIGKYTGEMARWLVEQGHQVRVITAPPYYPDWRVWKSFSTWFYDVRQEGGIKVIRCPIYVPAEPSAFKRMLHLTSFSISSSFAILSQLLWRPEKVILVVPTLFCAPQALLMAKVCRATSVLHIQDYEVDALFGLGLIKNDSLFKRYALSFERLILRAFDKVSTISKGMLQRARYKGVHDSKLLLFPNWSETMRFRNITRSADLLACLGVASDKRVILYSGNIGEKQGLETVIFSAERMQGHDKLQFLIVGEGAGKERLIKIAQQKSLPNIIFAPLQAYDDLPPLLASADCHLVVQKRGVADAVLPSKLTNILAVGGNAVITADSDTTLGQLCEDFPGIATLVAPESVDALVEGIEQALAMPSPNKIAYEYAQKFLDKDCILGRFVAEI